MLKHFKKKGYYMNQNTLIVYCGPMFSGKSGELLNAAQRAGYAKEKVVAFIPYCDWRSDDHIKSRFLNHTCFAIRIKFAYEIMRAIEKELETSHNIKSLTLLFDEAQFFHNGIVPIIRRLLNNELLPEIKKTIHVAGLDLDAWCRVFDGNVIPGLMALANEVKKFTAICFICGTPAIFTQKIGGSSNQIEIGDKDIYEARCRSCHTIPSE